MPDVLPSIQQYMTFNPLFQVTANLYPLVGCRLVVSVVTHLFDAILGRDDCQVTANGEVVVLADILSTVPAKSELFVIADGFGTVVADDKGLVVLDALAAVVPNHRGLVIVDDVVLVLLGVDENLFLSGLVLEADFVEALAFVGLGPDGHPRLVGRKFVGGRVGWRCSFGR